MMIRKGQRLDTGVIASNSLVTVVAPPTEGSNWNRLICDLDAGQ
jgi:hypothetical protein